MKEKRFPEFMSGIGPGGEIAPIQDVCGNIFPVPFIREVGFSQAIAEVTKPSIPHYHKLGFETYYIISGSGRVMVGNVIHHVNPDCFIQIEPLTAHCIFPYDRMLIMVCNTPPWAADDQFILEETNPEVKYDSGLERNALEDTLIHVSDMLPSAIVKSNLKATTNEELREAIGTYMIT
jgi:mannose-6-phosphate isomerase-like protein (cupin superfamily)